MKNPLISIVFLVSAFCAVVGQASAAPIVAAGSNYSIVIRGDQSGNPFTGTTVFDSLPSVFTRAGLTLTLTESEMALGGGISQITVDVSANGDLFPVPDETGVLSLGGNGDGLDLIIPVALVDARIQIYAGDKVFTSDNVVDLYTPAIPWDGIFPSLNNEIAIDHAGGVGFSRFVFIFQVSEIGPQQVPEPGSLVLGAIGLLAFAGTRMRRRKSAL